MSGAKALIDEIRRNHYSKKSSAQNTQTPMNTGTDSAAEEKSPVVRKRRTRKAIHNSEKISEMAGTLEKNLVSVSIVGAIVIPDFPLASGEKLVIAKLTPITMGS